MPLKSSMDSILDATDAPLDADGDLIANPSSIRLARTPTMTTSLAF